MDEEKYRTKKKQIFKLKIAEIILYALIVGILAIIIFVLIK